MAYTSLLDHKSFAIVGHTKFLNEQKLNLALNKLYEVSRVTLLKSEFYHFISSNIDFENVGGFIT